MMSGTRPFGGLHKPCALVLAAFAIVAGCSSGDHVATPDDRSTGRRTDAVFSTFLEEADYLLEGRLGVYVVMSLSSGPVTGGAVILHVYNLTDSEAAFLLRGLYYGKERAPLRSQEVRMAPRSQSRVHAGVVAGVSRWVQELEVTMVFESAGREVTKPLRLRRVRQDRFPRPAGLLFPWDPDPICTADADRDYVAGCLAWRKGESARAHGTVRALAERGHATAQWLMGLMHDLATPADFTTAVEWYRKSAEQGHPLGQWALAGMYATGRAVPRDYGEALRLYRKAAAQGEARAEHSLGHMYETGEGVAIDFVEAAAWYRRAAERGLPQAQNSLAAMYDNGRGVEKTFQKARYWWEQAAARGSLVALENLELLGRR